MPPARSLWPGAAQTNGLIRSMHTVDWWLTGIGVEDAELDRDVDVEEIYPISNILFSTAIMLWT